MRPLISGKLSLHRLTVINIHPAEILNQEDEETFRAVECRSRGLDVLLLGSERMIRIITYLLGYLVDCNAISCKGSM